jgi:hypothetical protein
VKQSTQILSCSVLFLFMVNCGVNNSRMYYQNNYNTSKPVPIMGRGRATTKQLLEFFSATNRHFHKNYVKKVIRTYVQESRIEGVNSDVAFCQMCIETNYLRFGGSVQKSQNNFCGLGATSSGNYSATFNSIRSGVRAHIQHLKAYASHKPLRKKSIDPRFDRVKRGSVQYVQNLSRTWATDPQYGYKIIQKLRELNDYLH